MPLFGFLCGKTCDCKNRCKSYFAGIPPLEDACKSACKEDSSINKDDFLCSGRFVDQLNIISMLGYDPCLGDDIGIDDTIAGQVLNENNEKWDKLKPIVLGLGILILASLAILYVVKK